MAIAELQRIKEATGKAEYDQALGVAIKLAKRTGLSKAEDEFISLESRFNAI